MCGVSIIYMDRVRNEEVQRRCGSELRIGEQMDRNVLRWYVMWIGWKKSEWLKECIGQRWMVVEEE
jgi:hypothetical protein